MQTDQKLLTEYEAAKALNCSVFTMRKMRYEGRGPAWVQYGPKLIRYDRAAIDEFIRSKTQGKDQ